MGRPSGQDHRNAQLTNQMADEIRERHRLGESQASLAREFDVSPSTIRRIIKLQAYYDGPKPGTLEYVGEKLGEAAVGLIVRVGEAAFDGAKAFSEAFVKSFNRKD